jgi:hypothetical protein
MDPARHGRFSRRTASITVLLVVVRLRATRSSDSGVRVRASGLAGRGPVRAAVLALTLSHVPVRLDVDATRRAGTSLPTRNVILAALAKLL